MQCLFISMVIFKDPNIGYSYIHSRCFHIKPSYKVKLQATVQLWSKLCYKILVLEYLFSRNRRRWVPGEPGLGVLCVDAQTLELRGWVAVCAAGTRKQAGTRVAVQPVRGAETAAVGKPEERAVLGCNIPLECPVLHASASSFCSETTFSPDVKESDREFMSARVDLRKYLNSRFYFTVTVLLYQEHLQYVWVLVPNTVCHWPAISYVNEKWKRLEQPNRCPDVIWMMDHFQYSSDSCWSSAAF